MGVTLPDDVRAILSTLQEQYGRPDDDGVAVVGSFSRGKAGPYSDLDVDWFRAEPAGAATETAGPAGQAGMAVSGGAAKEEHRFYSVGDRLVSVLFTTVAAAGAQLSQPEQAIWAAGGLRDMLILSDRRGSLAALRDQAAAFDWATLQPAAERHASRQLAKFGEETAKLLNALTASDAYSAANALTWLWIGLAKAMAVGLGVILQSENTYLAAVEAAVGRDTPWAHALRQAAGLEPASRLEQAAGLEPSPMLDRAAAGLRLYRETARLLDPILQPADRPTVLTVCGYIEGWLGGDEVTARILRALGEHTNRGLPGTGER